MTVIRIGDALATLDACPPAREWLASRPPVADVREHWQACPRGDWLLWLAGRADVDRKLLVRAACACAREALVHVAAGEDRTRIAIETAEAWTRGEVTPEMVRAAESGATSAAMSASEAAAMSASDAARAASLARSADLVRAIIPWADVDRGLYLRCGGVL